MTSPFDSYDVERCRARIASRNGVLGAILHEVPDRAAGGDGPLAGVPYVLKDVWDTAGIPTTGGSWRHRARIPSSSSHVFRALEATGAVLLGKSNLSDMAFSIESDNHIRGPVRNPHDEARTAGGSTGGGAAAVADGMAAFDWGSDFGGSIRLPSAFCGVVGLRLSAAAWPIGFHHFPRLPPFFWETCGMGPITRDVESARAVVDALRPALRRPGFPEAKLDPSRVVVWAPDEGHRGDWPTFLEDAGRKLDAADITWSIARDLPSPTRVNAIYIERLAAHLDEMMGGDELSFLEGLPAVALALLSGGRLDRRIHPNTAAIFLAVLAVRVFRRDKARVARLRADVLERMRAIWGSGALVVTPTTTLLPPRHGRAAFDPRLVSFCVLGNLVDATALAIPCGSFVRAPALSRSLQIVGPPGAEDAVLDLGARLSAASS